MKKTTPLRYLGPSHDGRTNRWRVTCPICGKQHDPPSTMLASNTTRCEAVKCQAAIYCNYNAQTATAYEEE